MWDKILPTLVATLFGAGLAWLVGTQVNYFWDERRRRRESDLTALATFYRLYSDFFATWKTVERMSLRNLAAMLGRMPRRLRDDDVR